MWNVIHEGKGDWGVVCIFLFSAWARLGPLMIPLRFQSFFFFFRLVLFSRIAFSPSSERGKALSTPHPNTQENYETKSSHCGHFFFAVECYACMMAFCVVLKVDGK
jgi:hypothetical protein